MTDFFSTDLPIGEVLADLCSALDERDELVLQAEPGAGKTTVVPLALLNRPWLNGQKIVILEPRRVAARAAAERMASLLGEKAGQTVGYRMRLDNCISEHTRIEVITEGILTRMLQDDPSLAGVGLVIFDEFHQRTLDADFGLALTLQGRSLFREPGSPLKILVMSATLDGDRVAALLGNAPVISSGGRSFPVAIHYGRAARLQESIVQPVVNTVCEVLASTVDSVLVFLPGQREITRVAEALQQRIADTEQVIVAPLYGGLSLQQQQQAIQPCPAGRRKVVLTTNIAETSLTIEGVSTVVDAGLAREPVFDPQTGMTRLRTCRISKASSVQRMGRAGRLGPGNCYRLWSEQQQQQLAAQTTPEILQADLAPLVLQMLAWGIDDPAELQWLDSPPKGPFQQARQLLSEFGAARCLNASGGWQLTEHGQQMAAMPAHPRLAHMLIVGAKSGLTEMACQLAALLSERDPLSRSGADLFQRLEILDGSSNCPAHLQSWRRRILQQAKRFAALCRSPSGRHGSDYNSLDRHDSLGLLVASAYPDRIARRRDGASRNYQLSNGRTATLPQHDNLVTAEWLAVAELGGQVGRAEDAIYSAAHFSSGLLDSELKSLVTASDVVHWDSRSEQFVAEHRQNLGAIVISNSVIDRIDPQAKVTALTELVRKRGLQLLPWNDQLRQWQGRVQLLHQHLGAPWPDVSDIALLDSLEQWLGPYLEPVNRLSHFRQLDLKSILQHWLPWPLPRQLDELAPLRLPVPSGSSIEIDYSQSPPVLAVKLQEMFGCQQTPSIANGKVELVIHLLSPARRPLQITRDLAGFWRSSYQQVKKEMKGRYPKHPWPDNPLEAIATSKTTKRTGG